MRGLRDLNYTRFESVTLRKHIYIKYYNINSIQTWAGDSRRCNAHLHFPNAFNVNGTFGSNCAGLQSVSALRSSGKVTKEKERFLSLGIPELYLIPTMLVHGSLWGLVECKHK